MALGGLWLASCGPLPGERDWPDAAPPIWEITDPETGHTGWLFGTVHALPRDLSWGTPLLDRTFQDAGVLVVEVENLEAPGGPTLIENLSTTADQPPLLARVDAADRPVVAALMRDADMEEGDFADTETWAAALTLAGAVRLGDPRYGVDRALIDSADELIGLEGFTVQIIMFDRLSQQAQSDLLANVARAHASGTDEAMLEAWLTGDEAALDALVNSAMTDSPELRAALLTDRNRAWSDTIARLIAEGRRPFVAVGAGHTVGRDGVGRMLQARGFTVRRIQ